MAPPNHSTAQIILILFVFYLPIQSISKSIDFTSKCISILTFHYLHNYWPGPIYHYFSLELILTVSSIFSARNVLYTVDRVIFLKSASDHVFPLLKALHWLPFIFRIKSQIPSLALYALPAQIVSPTMISCAYCSQPYYPPLFIEDTGYSLASRHFACCSPT